MVEMKSLYFDYLDDPPADSSSESDTDAEPEIPETDTDTDKDTESDEAQCVCKRCDFSTFEVEERWGWIFYKISTVIF